MTVTDTTFLAGDSPAAYGRIAFKAAIQVSGYDLGYLDGYAAGQAFGSAGGFGAGYAAGFGDSAGERDAVESTGFQAGFAAGAGLPHPVTFPSFANAAPASGAKLTGSTERVTFDVPNPTALPFAIAIKFASESRPFVAYDTQRGFYHPFKSSTVSGGITDLSFSLAQAGGWQDDIEEIFIGGVA